MSPESGSEVLKDAISEPSRMFSLKVDAETERFVGTSFRSLTFNLNIFSKVNPPESLVCILIE